MNTLAFRFDVDSVRCCRVGIPRLMKTADRLGVRFTFFLNLGFTFSWKHTLRHVARKQLRRVASSAPVAPPPRFRPWTSSGRWACSRPCS